MRKIIFVNRFYRPDHSATAQLLTDLAEKLAASGLSVHIVASRQLYQDSHANLSPREILAGVDIYRTWTSRFGRGNLLGRAFDYLSFYLSSSIQLIRIVKRGDILVVKTDPPMLSVVGATVAKIKGAKLINWLQDLFPEVAKELGIGLNKPLYSVLKSLRDWSLRVADCNVVLGELMAERVDMETAGSKKSLVIPNWVIDADLEPITAHENKLREQWQLDKKFVVGYSGNLGRAHDYQTIHNTAIALRDQTHIVFLLVGDGAGTLALRALALRDGLTNIVFMPYQPMAQLNMSLAAADVHWVSLDPKLEGMIVPSKAYGIFAVGRPLFFIGSIDGEIARLVNRNHCGFVITPGDSKMMSDLLLNLAGDPVRLETMSINSRALYEREFKYGNSIEKWRNAITQWQV